VGQDGILRPDGIRPLGPGHLREQTVAPDALGRTCFSLSSRAQFDVQDGISPASYLPAFETARPEKFVALAFRGAGNIACPTGRPLQPITNRQQDAILPHTGKLLSCFRRRKCSKLGLNGHLCS